MLFNLLRRRFVILHDPPFRALFIRMCCNRMADGIIYVVTAWLLLRLTQGKASSVAFQFTLTLLPSALLSPFIGVWTDRLSRRVIVMASDFFQGILILLTALLLACSFTGVWYVYAMTLAVGISGMFHQIAARALLREVVSKNTLLLASSTISVANQSGGLLGPVVGGVIAFHFGEMVALVFGGLLSIAGGLSLRNIAHTTNAHVTVRNAGIRNFVHDYKDGIITLKNNIYARRMFIGCVLFYISLPLLNFMLPLLLKQFEYDVQTFGLVDAMFGVGGVCAGIALHGIEERLGHHRMMESGVFFFGLLIVLFPWISHESWLLIIYFGIGFCCHSGVTLMSELQSSLSHAVQGRVISLFNILVSLIATVIIQLISFSDNKLSISKAYLGYGALMIFFVIFFLRRWVQKAKI